MMKTIFSVALMIPFVGLLAWAVASAAAMPDVHFSYATNECVKVVNYSDDNFSCENYPAKFNHVWVE